MVVEKIQAATFSFSSFIASLVNAKPSQKKSEKVFAEEVFAAGIEKPDSVLVENLNGFTEYYIVTDTKTPRFETAVFLEFQNHLAIFYSADRKYIEVDVMQFGMLGTNLSGNGVFTNINAANKYYQSLCGKKVSIVEQADLDRRPMVIDVESRFIY